MKKAFALCVLLVLLIAADGKERDQCREERVHSRSNAAIRGNWRDCKQENILNMKIIKDSIDIIDGDGVFWASVHFEAVLSWYLFPLVFVKKAEYMRLPSVEKNGMCWVSIPHRMQKDWLLKCFCSWGRYKRLVLLPYFANLHHYHLTGRFANGEYSSGIEGVFEYQKETLCSQ